MTKYLQVQIVKRQNNQNANMSFRLQYGNGCRVKIQKVLCCWRNIRSSAVLWRHGAGECDLSKPLQEDVYFRYNHHGWSCLFWTNIRSRWRRDIWATKSRGKGVILCFIVGFNLTLQAEGEPRLMLARLVRPNMPILTLVFWYSCWLLYNIL